jgi:hypothetical protein
VIYTLIGGIDLPEAIDRHGRLGRLATVENVEAADYCLWLPDGSRQPCYAPASLVLVRPSGDTLGFSCAEHRDAWATRIQGRYDVLTRGGAGRKRRHCGGVSPGGGGRTNPTPLAQRRARRGPT